MSLKVRVEVNTKQSVFHWADRAHLRGMQRGAEFGVLGDKLGWGEGQDPRLVAPQMQTPQVGPAQGLASCPPPSWFDSSSLQTLAENSLVRTGKV